MAASRPPPPTPEALFERWRRYGDAEALGAVFDATSPALFRIALALLPDAATAEDALQETYLSAMQHADAYDATRPLVPWLVGVLQNMAHRQRRSFSRRPDPARLAAAGAALSAVPDLDEAERAEEAARLREAIDALDEPYRGVALLRWRYGLEPAEIADVRNEPPGTTRSLLSRALGRLRHGGRAFPAALAGASVPRGLAAVREAILDTLVPAGASAGVAGGLLLWKTLAGVGAAAAVVAGVVIVGNLSGSEGQGAAGDGAGEVATADPAIPAPPPPVVPDLRGSAAPGGRSRGDAGIATGGGSPRKDAEEATSAAPDKPATGTTPDLAAPANPSSAVSGPGAGDAFQASVAQAVKDGAAWLAKRQQKDGSWVASGAETSTVTSQALYVLLRAGFARDDPVVAKGFDWLRKADVERAADWSATAASWALLATLARTQAAASKEAARQSILSRSDESVAKALAGRLDRLWITEGWFATDEPSTGGGRKDADTRTLSLALVALAAKHAWSWGSVDATAILDRVLAPQEAQGLKHPRAIGDRGPSDVARGLPERAGSPAGVGLATTTSALVAFHVAWQASDQTKPRRLPGMWTERRVLESVHDAYAWLDRHWPELDAQSIAGELRVEQHLPWFVEVERLTALLGSDAIGEHDAFREMARALLDTPLRRGGWLLPALPDDPRATIQALLVLTRSTRSIVEKPFLEKKAAPAK